MPEISSLAERPIPVTITTELRQKTESVKLLIAPAKQEAVAFSSRAQQFLAQATPDNLRLFIIPLLLPEGDNNISVAEREVAGAVEFWRDGVKGERQLMTMLADTNLLPVSADNLKKTVAVLEQEHEGLTKGFWSRVTKRVKLNNVKQQLTTARGYLALYDGTVGPLVNELTEVNDSVATAVNAVVKRLDEVAKESPEQNPSNAEEEVSKERVLDQLE